MSEASETRRTRASVLTAPGRSAIAVVAVAGPAAVELVERHFQAANGRPLAGQPLSRIIYGHWDGAAGEDLVVCRRGADEVEIHCHGGTQSATRIVAALVQDGAQQLDWREWVAEHNNPQLEAEAQVALASATTLRTAKVLLDQFHGALRRELESILTLLSTNASEAAERIEQLLSRSDFGVRLTRPWRVAIVGRPNVGKSTLVNALAGYQRAIEFDQPGTTRDVVSVVTAFDGWPVELSDTAGLHRTNDEIELAGIALAREQITKADLALWLLDATALSANLRASVAEIVAGEANEVAAAWSLPRTLIVVNKCDLANVPASLRGGYLRISAASGQGVAELIDALAERLVPHPPAAGEAVPFTVRQIELLREALEHCRHAPSAAADAITRMLANDH